MNNETTTSRKYKRYDEAFKRSAVELWLQGGQSVRQIAADLGITSQSLKLWKKQLAVLPATGPGQRSLPQLEEENRRLKRELHGALRRCDILKKTLGILSNPNDNALNA